jgi:hypothetical protein
VFNTQKVYHNFTPGANLTAVEMSCMVKVLNLPQAANAVNPAGKSN